MAYEINGDLEVDGNINVVAGTDATGTLAYNTVVSSGTSNVFSSVEVVPETEFQALTFPGTQDGKTQYLVSGTMRVTSDSNSGEVNLRTRMRIGQSGDATDPLIQSIPTDFSDDGAARLWFRLQGWFFLYTPESGDTLTLTALTDNAADDAFWNVGSWVTIIESP